MITLLTVATLLFAEEWPVPIEREVCRGHAYGSWSEPDENGRMHRVPLDSTGFEAHFPVGATDDPIGDLFACTWYTHHLTALGERPLPSPASGTHFRLTWLRSFHRPMSFRVTVDADTREARLVWREANGAGGYAPGQLALREDVTLDRIETATFLAHLNAAGICEATPEAMGGLDGAQWIFERSGPNAYCLHDAWAPPEAMRDLGHFLFDFADVPTGERY